MSLPESNQNAAKVNPASTSQFYAASRLKRSRRTRAELDTIQGALHEYAKLYNPVTVRQLYYAMSVQYLVPKDDAGYDVVQRELLKMRRAGALPYEWISDNSRWMRKPRSFSSIEEALESAARTYRRDVWINAPVYVELWCEKDALAGVLMEETVPYDVPLMVAKGFSSDSYLYSTGMYAASVGKPCHYYYFGDHDPSGVVIPQKIEEGILRHAPNAEIHFHRVAVSVEQIEAWNLPTRPTKKSDSRAKNFKGDSCELDALPPAQLRALARACIENHITPRELAQLKWTENEERRTWLSTLGGVA